MRISDWSSDVCSSDLESCESLNPCADRPIGGLRPGWPSDLRHRTATPLLSTLRTAVISHQARQPHRTVRCPRRDHRDHHDDGHPAAGDDPRPAAGRSEEHTSELQSLMRISSAVYSLKKKQI